MRLPASICLALLMSACAPDEPQEVARAGRQAPPRFLWGSATAGFQVDMGCPSLPDDVCLDRASDWYQWVTTPEIVDEGGMYVTGQDVRDGPGMWELFEQDVAQMRADGHTAYRMSLEWSRLFPDSAEDVDTVEGLDALANEAAVKRYHEMFAALAAADISPLVTVNHYVLPLWVHDGVACHQDLATCPARGWVDGERMTRLISLYAGWVGKEFGGDVDRWATLNEPFAITLAGYLQPGESRSNPPGLRFDGPSVVASLRNQIEAHAAMYDALHLWDVTDADADGTPADVGIVLNLVDAVPRDPDNDADVRATAHADHLYHRLFLEGITSGQWDDDLDGTFDRVRPELAGRADFLGVNYYNEMKVMWLPLRPFGDLVPAFDFLPEFSWDPHPVGLRNVVRLASAYDLPIYITENGTPEVDRSDAVLLEHLEFLWEALDEGADVRGYLWWSWVDNYEWNHGLDLRFGLYTFDPVTKARSPRPVAATLADVIAKGGLD